MKPPEERKKELVLEWLTKAEKEYVAADILLKSDPFVLGVVTFLAQQAAEKFLKAYLVWKQINFAALERVAQGVLAQSGHVGQDARGLALRMDHGTQYLSDHFQNQVKFCGIAPSFAFLERPQKRRRNE
jgi:hypothetical protein